jgi:nucleotide-binding universal stress UspA family protein
MKKVLITDKLDADSRIPLEYGLGMAKNLGLFPQIIHVDQFADLNAYNHIFAGLNIEVQKDYFEKILNANNDRLAKQIKELDVDFDELKFETLAGNPADEIVEYAKDPDIDLIILGNDNQTVVDKIFIGSVSDKVINKVEKSVLLVKNPKFSKPKKIMVPYDFSDLCDNALTKAIEIAKINHAKVVLVNVLESHYDGFYASYVVKNGLNEAMTEMIEQVKLEITQKFNDLIKKHDLGDMLSFEIALDREGRISDSLNAFSKANQFDFIVMGSHKRGKVMRSILGSVAYNLIRNTDNPILIVK